jgi:hypothetical protein
MMKVEELAARLDAARARVKELTTAALDDPAARKRLIEVKTEVEVLEAALADAQREETIARIRDWLARSHAEYEAATACLNKRPALRAEVEAAQAKLYALLAAEDELARQEAMHRANATNFLGNARRIAEKADVDISTLGGNIP